MKYYLWGFAVLMFLGLLTIPVFVLSGSVMAMHEFFRAGKRGTAYLWQKIGDDIMAVMED
jgi:hypothetical protein